MDKQSVNVRCKHRLRQVKLYRSAHLREMRPKQRPQNGILSLEKDQLNSGIKALKAGKSHFRADFQEVDLTGRSLEEPCIGHEISVLVAGSGAEDHDSVRTGSWGHLEGSHREVYQQWVQPTFGL